MFWTKFYCTTASGKEEKGNWLYFLFFHVNRLYLINQVYFREGIIAYSWENYFLHIYNNITSSYTFNLNTGQQLWKRVRKSLHSHAAYFTFYLTACVLGHLWGEIGDNVWLKPHLDVSNPQLVRQNLQYTQLQTFTCGMPLRQFCTERWIMA